MLTDFFEDFTERANIGEIALRLTRLEDERQIHHETRQACTCEIHETEEVLELAVKQRADPQPPCWKYRDPEDGYEPSPRDGWCKSCLVRQEAHEARRRLTHQVRGARQRLRNACKKYRDRQVAKQRAIESLLAGGDVRAGSVADILLEARGRGPLANREHHGLGNADAGDGLEYTTETDAALQESKRRQHQADTDEQLRAERAEAGDGEHDPDHHEAQ